MIYIHGGGLVAGSGDMGIDGIVRNFVSKGIVVASLQYRMGWLGNN
jgi:carboxylesterase type B